MVRIHTHTHTTESRISFQSFPGEAAVVAPPAGQEKKKKEDEEAYWPPVEVKDTAGGIVWGKTKDEFYYLKQDEAKRPYQLWRP